MKKPRWMRKFVRQVLKNIFIRVDDQQGYNLRSKNAAPKPLLVSPSKKKEVATKQLVALVKQTSIPTKQ
jgi:hypothetical protein